jgi:hypothetical protein
MAERINRTAITYPPEQREIRVFIKSRTTGRHQSAWQPRAGAAPAWRTCSAYSSVLKAIQHVASRPNYPDF